MSGEDSVAGIEKASEPGEDAQKIEWEGPPDSPHRIPVDLRPLDVPAIGEEQPDMSGELFARDLQRTGYPCRLKAFNAKASF